jgi:LysM repeat protein
LKLIEINGDRAKRLVAGTTIKIPVKAIHTVQSGESFSSISDKYKIKIRAICVANKLEKENPLKLGQKLIIPLSK